MRSTLTVLSIVLVASASFLNNVKAFKEYHIYMCYTQREFQIIWFRSFLDSIFDSSFTLVL